MRLIWPIRLAVVSLVFLTGGYANATERTRVSTENYQVQAIAFSPDGSMIALAYGSPDEGGGVIRLLAVNGMKQICVLKGHEKPISCLQFTPDSSTLISGGLDECCILWDVIRHQQKAKLKGHKDRILSISISSDGSHVATSSDDKTVLIWSLQEKKVVRKLTLEKTVSRAIAYLPKRNILVTGCDDHIVRLWDLNSGKLAFTLDKHGESITSIGIFPKDSDTIAIGSADGKVKLWSISAEKNIADDIISWDFGMSTPLALVVAPDGRHVCIGTRGGQIAICSVSRANSVIAEVRINAHDFPVFSLAISPDGRSLASGSLLEPDMMLWKKWPE